MRAWTRAHFPPGRKRNEGGQRARPGTNSCIERQLARLKDEELCRKTAAFAFTDSSDLFFLKEPKPAEPTVLAASLLCVVDV